MYAKALLKQEGSKVCSFFESSFYEFESVAYCKKGFLEVSIQTNVWCFLFCQGFCTLPEQTSNTTNLYNTLHTKTNAHTKRPLLNVVEDCIQNFIYYFIRIFCDFAGYFLDYLQYVIRGFSACTMYILPYFLIHMCMWSNVCYCLRYTA